MQRFKRRPNQHPLKMLTIRIQYKLEFAQNENQLLFCHLVLNTIMRIISRIIYGLLSAGRDSFNKWRIFICPILGKTEYKPHYSSKRIVWQKDNTSCMEKYFSYLPYLTPQHPA